MLSIIIPTLNEEQHIEKLLHQLEAQKSLSFEIIVSDGGSADATLKIAKNMGAIIVSGEPGRGRQLNKGTLYAKGEYFFFSARRQRDRRSVPVKKRSRFYGRVDTSLSGAL